MSKTRREHIENVLEASVIDKEPMICSRRQSSTERSPWMSALSLLLEIFIGIALAVAACLYLNQLSPEERSKVVQTIWMLGD